MKPGIARIILSIRADTWWVGNRKMAVGNVFRDFGL